MGSQSVTNFTTVKMNRIRDLVKSYSPRGSQAAEQAVEIGAAAVGTLRTAPRKQRSEAGVGGPPSAVVKATPPTSEFEKALNSESVKAGLSLIFTLIDQLKKDPEKIHRESAVVESRHPVVGISVFLKKMHESILTKAQLQTESAFAANEALPRTIIEVVSQQGPHGKEPVDVDWKSLVKALEGSPPDRIVKTYLENVASGLIDLVLDASRGRIPPDHIEKVKRSVREHFVPDLIARTKLKRKRRK